MFVSQKRHLMVTRDSGQMLNASSQPPSSALIEIPATYEALPHNEFEGTGNLKITLI